MTKFIPKIAFRLLQRSVIFYFFYLGAGGGTASKMNFLSLQVFKIFIPSFIFSLFSFHLFSPGISKAAASGKLFPLISGDRAPGAPGEKASWQAGGAEAAACLPYG